MAMVLALLGGTSGWVTKSQSIWGAQIDEIKAFMNGDRVIGRDGQPRHGQSRYGYLWHMPGPDDADQERGLGGGITWTWDPLLCSRLEPRFREDIPLFGSFITCDDYKAAVARAFDKWSANNRYIKFLDVSAECDRLGVNTGPPFGDRQPRPSWAESDQQFHGGCPLAEIWVTAAPPSTPGSGGTAVATAATHPRFTRTFKFTNGERPRRNIHNIDRCPNGPTCQPDNGEHEIDFVEVVSGTFSFNTEDICWYMDAEFCAPFHRLKHSMGGASNARMFVNGMTYGLMSLGIVFYICFFCAIFLRASGVDNEAEDDEDGDGQLSVGERFNTNVRSISHYPPIILALFIALLIIPPLLNTRIFAPCFDCYDFEAAALHEIGHFLGLGHPDNIPSNWAYPGVSFAGPAGNPAPGNISYNALIAPLVQNGTRPNQTTIDFFCRHPWANVSAGVPPNATVDDDPSKAYPTRNCQMEARTQHNPLACLTDDDLEGLAVMYPDCGSYALFTNVCHKVQINIGFVRCSVYLLVPFIFALLGVVTCSSIVHQFERREKERLAKMAEEAGDALAAAKAGKGKKKAAKAASTPSYDNAMPSDGV